jgi:hypothetical protein
LRPAAFSFLSAILLFADIGAVIPVSLPIDRSALPNNHVNRSEKPIIALVNGSLTGSKEVADAAIAQC